MVFEVEILIREEKEAFGLHMKGIKLFSEKRWVDTISSFNEAAKRYNEASKRHVGQGMEKSSLRCRGLSWLSEAEKSMVEVFQNIELKEYDRSLTFSQHAIDELRKASKLFSNAHFEEEKRYSQGFLQFAKGKFYEAQGLRHLETYNVNKASKYFGNAFNAYGEAFLALREVSFSGMLSRGLIEAELSRLETKVSKQVKQISGLQEELRRREEEALHYKRELLTCKSLKEELSKKLEGLSSIAAKKFTRADLSLLSIAGINVTYAVIEFLFLSFHPFTFSSLLPFLFVLFATLVLFYIYRICK